MDPFQVPTTMAGTASRKPARSRIGVLAGEQEEEQIAAAATHVDDSQDDVDLMRSCMGMLHLTVL